MWIITNKGFMSVVAKDRQGKPSGPQPDAIVSVRFRRAEDAAAIFPGVKYIATPNGDYAGRVFVTRAEAARRIAEIAAGIDYTNFKSSIGKDDKALYDACMAGWHVFGKLQPGGPYGSGLRNVGRQASLFDDAAPYVGAYGGRVSGGAYAPKGRDWMDDPFCDGCGMRVGAAKLDADHFCADCVREFEAEASLPGPDPVLPMEAPDCWSCGDVVASVDANGLCEVCAPAYADVDPELMASIRRGS